MMRISGLAIIALLLPGAGFAAIAPARPAASAAKAPAAVPLVLTPGIRRVTMSPEGNVIASRILGTPDAKVSQIQAEMAGLLQQKAQFVSGAPIDLDKLEALLRREETLVAEYKTHQNDRLIALLKALPEPDRIAFLQSRAAQVKTQNAKPAEPGR